ncbi:MAG: UDP-N-acetylmuramate--L-alanine ligase [Magnetococcales bacterium]|nr:UDP-N-acetylmuramate--L-alanine ligase [Magnetococcales bacterium]HIJ84033.1 UDP-N-acetylmuramate--L-alanine ligase [Magnetococcales bacterium]
MYEKIRKLHFVGIGGIGMSGIAELMINLGYQVSGSDPVANARTQRLVELGAVIQTAHDAQNVLGADVVIRSSAVGCDNPEIQAARNYNIPVAKRAEMLAELMRIKYGIAIAGTHGKTTTTSMVASILGEAGMDPTIVNGGIVKALNSNARLGSGDFLVAEADESDGTFLKLFPTIAVVTNIEPEHMEHYGTIDALRGAFFGFLEKIPFYGLGVVCRDHPETRALLPLLSDKRMVGYGFDAGSDIQAVSLERRQQRNCFTILRKTPITGTMVALGELHLAQPGNHNVLNALAAVAVALELDIEWPVIVAAMDHFKGVQRRFDILLDGPDRSVIDDYAHHPTEIMATLKAAREVYPPERRIVAIFQPHRYSRLAHLFEEFLRAFTNASLVFVDRVHSAGERMPEDRFPQGERAPLMEGIRLHSGVPTLALPAGENWREALEGYLDSGDVLVFLGAGSITHRARDYAGSWSKVS